MCCMYLSINGDVPEVESSLSVHTSEECGVDGGPLNVIDILIVVLKRAEWMPCLALWKQERKRGGRAKRGRREEGREGRKVSERVKRGGRERGKRAERGRRKEGSKRKGGKEGEQMCEERREEERIVLLLHIDTCNIEMKKAVTLIRELTDSCCSVCSFVLQSLMVQSKEDVRNRWERSTLEGGRKKMGGREGRRKGGEEEGGKEEEEEGEGRREREGGGGEEGVRENKQRSKTHQMVSNKSLWLHPPGHPLLGVC